MRIESKCRQIATGMIRRLLLCDLIFLIVASSLILIGVVIAWPSEATCPLVVYAIDRQFLNGPVGLEVGLPFNTGTWPNSDDESIGFDVMLDPETAKSWKIEWIDGYIVDYDPDWPELKLTRLREPKSALLKDGRWDLSWHDLQQFKNYSLKLSLQPRDRTTSKQERQQLAERIMEDPGKIIKITLSQ